MRKQIDDGNGSYKNMDRHLEKSIDYTWVVLRVSILIERFQITGKFCY